MQKVKILFFGLFAASAVGASAQFDGAAPLAWRWQYSGQVAPEGSPIVRGNNVYVAVGGRIFCIDKASGNNKWQFPQLEPMKGTFRDTPAVIGDLIIGGTDERWLVAVNMNDGSEKWRIQVPATFASAPVVVGKFLVAPLTNDTLIAVDSETGNSVWKTEQPIEGGLKGSIAVSGSDVLFFNHRDELHAFNVNTRKDSWRQRFNSVPMTVKPVVLGDTVYTFSANFVVALNANNGSARWQRQVSHDMEFAPAVSPEGIMVVLRDGKVYLLDTGGRIKYREPLDLDSTPTAAPVAMGKKFMIPTTNGLLNLIDPATNKVSWSFHVKPVAATAAGAAPPPPPTGRNARPAARQQNRVPTVAVFGSPVTAGNTLLVLAADGSLLAFDKEIGVDLTSPVVKMLWPNPGDLVSGLPPLELVFRVQDEAAGVDEDNLSVSINGVPMEFDYTRDGIVVVRFTALGANKELQTGRARIILEANDWLGNKSLASYTLSIDNTLPPAGKSAEGAQQGRTRPPGGRGKSGGAGAGGGGGLGGGGFGPQ